MPLYEWECLACGLTFEELAPASDSRVERPCPSCGRPSPRVVSTFAIATAPGTRPATAAPQPGTPKVPMCLKYPHIPLMCHMDQKTAERAVAYAYGRGAEYDDKTAAREELRNKRGEPPPPQTAAAAHSHAHNPRRHRVAEPAGHDHSGHDHQVHQHDSGSAKGDKDPASPGHSH